MTGSGVPGWHSPYVPSASLLCSAFRLEQSVLLWCVCVYLQVPFLPPLIACDTIKHGSWSLSKGTPAEVLYKGTITRIIGEDSPGRAEKAREDVLPKGHVIYEGKKGHILTYDGESGICSLVPRARRGVEPGTCRKLTSCVLYRSSRGARSWRRVESGAG